MTSRLTGLWRNSDFMLFWAGQTISLVGSSITGLALPLIAAQMLDATPEQMGVLSALGFAAYLFSLPAGAWIDRIRRRPLMIWADVGRVVFLAIIPVIAALNLLRIEYLYGIALITGILTVFFELAYIAYLPLLSTRENIVEANAKLETSRSASQLLGPGMAGALIQVVGATMAMIVDAASFAVSAVTLLLIRKPEPMPEAPAEKRHLLADIAEGIRVVLGNRLLLTLTIGTTLFNFFASLGNPVLFLFLLDELHLEAATIGPIFSVAGVGTMLGAVMSKRITDRVGLGVAIAGAGIVGATGWLLVPLAQPPTPLAFGMVALGEAILGAAVMVFNINILSLRQSIVPDRLLARVAATQRTVVLGIIPVAALLGGFLGGWIGLRPTLLVSVIGSLIPGFLILFTPIVRIKSAQQAVEQFAIE